MYRINEDGDNDQEGEEPSERGEDVSLTGALLLQRSIENTRSFKKYTIITCHVFIDTTNASQIVWEIEWEILYGISLIVRENLKTLFQLSRSRSTIWIYK